MSPSPPPGTNTLQVPRTGSLAAPERRPVPIAVKGPGEGTDAPRSVSPPPAAVDVVLGGRARRRSFNSGGGPKVGSVSAANSPRLQAIADGPIKPLNTHSPVALAAAAAVSADKIARLLATQGPLAIRHITAHLATTIPGFGDLSLSKQRRLIIAVLDNGDPIRDIAFDKVGWGRWAVRSTDASGAPDGDANKNGPPKPLEPRPITVRGPNGSDIPFPRAHRFSSPAVHQSLTLKHLLSDTDRRESISRQLPSHRPPISPRLVPEDDDVVLEGEDLYKRDDQAAVFSDSDDDDHHDTDEEDWQSMGPTTLRATSPREQEAIAALVQLRSV